MTTRVRMKIGIMGTVEGQYAGCDPGDVIDIALDERAHLWAANKWCDIVNPDTPISARQNAADAHY